MKFVHIADMHFDGPFTNLSNRDLLGEKRRLDQRKVFKKVIEYIKENNVEYFFISGDLYEQKYIKKSTIEYINNLCKEIPNTNIFISPGNHDPYIKNSYYNTYSWSDNIKVFNKYLEKVEIDNINIYGYGFSDFYMKNSIIDMIEIEDNSKINILVTHGSMEGSSNDFRQYNPLNVAKLKKLGFDYIALGHIHKTNYKENENTNIIYPGSTISMGFDELGKHGMIVGEINKKKLELEFIELDERQFVEINLDVTPILSKEELIEQINEIYIQENQYAKIILTGKRNFEINIYEFYKLITNDKIIKIKNNTQINFNLNDLANDTTLKGLYANKMLEKLSNNNLSEEEIDIIQKAIEIGFDVLN